MFLSNNRFCKYWKECILVAGVLIACVLLKYCNGSEKPEQPVLPETTVVEITSVPTLTPTMTPVPTLTPTPEPTPTPIIEESVRENTLYYVFEEQYNSKHYLDEEYQDYLYQMCVKYGIPEYYELLFVQMYHESRFKIELISKTNDYGLMQINTCNHEWLSKKLGSDNFLDPYVSIEAGTLMMSNYLKKYNDAHKALVCYNSGESKVKNGTYSTKYSKCVINDLNKLVAIEEQKGEEK